MTLDEPDLILTVCDKCGHVRARDGMAWDAEMGTHGPFCHRTLADKKACDGVPQRVVDLNRQLKLVPLYRRAAILIDWFYVCKGGQRRPPESARKRAMETVEDLDALLLDGYGTDDAVAGKLAQLVAELWPTGETSKC